MVGSNVGPEDYTARGGQNPVVAQFAKPFTTKDTTVHEGKATEQEPSWYFVSFVVQDFLGRMVKLNHCPGSATVEERAPQVYTVGGPYAPLRVLLPRLQPNILEDFNARRL